MGEVIDPVVVVAANLDVAAVVAVLAPHDGVVSPPPVDGTLPQLGGNQETEPFGIASHLFGRASGILWEGEGQGWQMRL